MARVVLIKPFTGLSLAVAQLAAELRRAGHDCLIVFFKDYRAAPVEEAPSYQQVPYSVTISLKRGRDWSFTYHTPASERELDILCEEVRAFSPNLIGLSVTTSAMPIAELITERLRCNFTAPIIWGGVGPTLERERALAHADLLCTNEGEEVIVELARRVDDGRPLDDIPGTWARTGDGTSKNEERPPLSMDDIAIPDFNPAGVIRIEDECVERNVIIPQFDTYILMSSRGCPFSCSFCIESIYQEMFGKKGSLRRRSVDLVIAELVAARKQFLFDCVQFFDDVFTTHRNWLREFAPRYAREVGLPFWCYTYPTTTRADDIDLLRDAGCTAMTMGIQSGSERILKERFHRPTQLNAVLKAANIIVDAGVDLYVDLITKVDYETEEDLRANVDLLMSLPRGVKVTGFGHMVKFPNYLYSHEVERDKPVPAVSDELYAYYHRLYYLALAPLSLASRQAIAHDPLYRRHPELLDTFMSKDLLTLSLFDPAKKRKGSNAAVVDMSTAQALVDPQHLAWLPEVDTRRRLTVLS